MDGMDGKTLHKLMNNAYVEKSNGKLKEQNQCKTWKH